MGNNRYIARDTLFGVKNLEQESIDIIRQYEPDDGYYLAFSGGKDSIVLKDLVIRSGVKFDAHYNVTTIDPPDLLVYIKHNHPEVIWEYPEEHFLKKLVKKGFPLRQARWCCDLYKERGGKGRTVLLGIRHQESANRSHRKIYEQKRNDKHHYFISPIIRWDDSEIWDYIHNRRLPYCKLYDEGWKRIGCILCPFSSVENKKREIERYPNMVKGFRNAFRKLFAKGEADGKPWTPRWQSGDEMFDWWVYQRDTNSRKDETQRQLL